MSIRLRVAVVFTLALAAAFTLGGWLFVSQLSAAMLRPTDAALAARLSRAAQYTADDEEGKLPPSFLAGQPGPGQYVVQVIDTSGRSFASARTPGGHRCCPRLNSARPGTASSC